LKKKGMEQENTHISTVLDGLMLAMPRGEIELRDDRKKTKWLAEIKPGPMGSLPQFRQSPSLVKP